MTQAAPTLEQAADNTMNLARVRPTRSLWSNAWRQFRKHRLAMAGLVVFIFLILSVLIGPLLWPGQVNDPFAYNTGERPSSSSTPRTPVLTGRPVSNLKPRDAALAIRWARTRLARTSLPVSCMAVASR
jgi:hypothetical protein